MSSEEQQYWVVKILNHRPPNFRINQYFSKNDQLEYKIKWGGVDPDTKRSFAPTWEPANHMETQVADMIKEYWAKLYPQRKDDIYGMNKRPSKNKIRIKGYQNSKDRVFDEEVEEEENGSNDGSEKIMHTGAILGKKFGIDKKNEVNHNGLKHKLKQSEEEESRTDTDDGKPVKKRRRIKRVEGRKPSMVNRNVQLEDSMVRFKF